MDNCGVHIAYVHNEEKRCLDMCSYLKSGVFDQVTKTETNTHLQKLFKVFNIPLYLHMRKQSRR